MTLTELQKNGKQLEREIVASVKSFMERNGWRQLRMQSGKFANASGNIFQVGQKGMADFLFLMYLAGKPGACIQLWVEVKRPGAKLREDQIQWIAGERQRGALVAVVDDVKEYCEWYHRTLGWLHDGRMKGQVALF